MSLVSGMRNGMRNGMLSGFNPGSGIPGVTLDAASGKYFPADAAEWAAFIAGAGLSGITVPTSVYNFQEASGNIIDSVGSFNLTAGGTGASYQQTETGFTRKALVNTDGGAYFYTTSAALPNPASASMLALLVERPIASAIGYQSIIFGDAVFAYLACYSAGKLQVVANSGANNALGNNVITGAARPIALRYNFTGSDITGFTDTEKVTPTWAACASKAFSFLSQAPGAALYGVRWDGVNAEVSNTHLKALMQALGWTVTWSP